jgi:hypothetical protein
MEISVWVEACRRCDSNAAPVKKVRQSADRDIARRFHFGSDDRACSLLLVCAPDCIERAARRTRNAETRFGHGGRTFWARAVASQGRVRV